MMKPSLWVLLILLALLFGCSSGNGEYQATSSVVPPDVEITREVNITLLSNMISEIIAQPDAYLGQEVEITGYFRGWDLLREAQGGPPVTRSDWVIADSSGAIYVTGSMPEGLDPASRKDTDQIIRLQARVAENEVGIYLEALSVVVIPSE